MHDTYDEAQEFKQMEASDAALHSHIREASKFLGECIRKARAGVPFKTRTHPKPVAAPQIKKRYWTDERLAPIREMRARGVGVSVIARKTGMTTKQASMVLARYVDRR